MSKLPENEVFIPQQLHQTRFSQGEASQQAMSEFRDEELEVVAGGAMKRSLRDPGQLERIPLSAMTMAEVPVFLHRRHTDRTKQKAQKEYPVIDPGLSAQASPPAPVNKSAGLRSPVVPSPTHLISMGVAFLAGLFLLLGSPGSDLSTMVVTTGLDGARADLVAALLLTSLAALVGAISRQSRAGALFGASLAFGCGYLAHFIQNALQPTYDPAGNLEQLNALALLSRSCTLAALALLAAFIGTTVGGALAQILLDPLVQLFKRGWRRKPLPAGQKRSAWQGLPLLGAWLRALALGAIFVMSIGSRDLFLYAPDVNVHTIMPAKVNRALAAHGTILTDHLVSQSTRREQTFLLYLPPSYFLEQARTKRYPVLYLLHGSPGAAQDWFVAGQANTSADALITMSRISEVILVLPDGNGLPGMTSEWADSWNRAQLIETYVSHELVSYVDQHYRTLADASHRAIGGLSMGGFGAMNMAIHHPDVFGRVLSFGGYYQAEGAIWGKNVAYQQANSPLITIRQNQQAQKLHIYLGAASEDQPYYNDTRQFAHTLDELHIPYAFDVLPGHHSWNVWQSQLYHALLWLHWT